MHSVLDSHAGKTVAPLPMKPQFMTHRTADEITKLLWGRCRVPSLALASGIVSARVQRSMPNKTDLAAISQWAEASYHADRLRPQPQSFCGCETLLRPWYLIVEKSLRYGSQWSYGQNRTSIERAVVYASFCTTVP